MSYISHKEIDGVVVVTGFKAPPMDPMATKRIVKVKIEETDLHKAMKKIADDLGEQAKGRRDIIRVSNYNDQNDELSPEEKVQNKAELDQMFKDIDAKIAEYSAQLKAMYPKYRELKREVTRDNTVYPWTPHHSEIDGNTCDGLKAKFELLESEEFLTRDGDVIKDNRRRTFMFRNKDKWHRKEIKKLGETVPQNAIDPSDLTFEDRQQIRRESLVDSIAAMSPSEREHRKVKMLERARLRAVDVERGYQLEGKEDAEALAMTWLAEQIADIKELYNGTD